MHLSIAETYLFYAFIVLVATSLIWASETCKERHILIRFNRFNYNLDLFRLGMTGAAYVLLLIPLAIRNCGTDTPQYYMTYVSDDTSGMDFCFYYLCKILHSLIREPKIGLGIISGATLFLMFFAVYRIRHLIDARFAFLAFFTGIYFYLYNYMRIMVALSFIMIGFSYIVDYKPKKAFVFLCAGILFHRSAIVVLAVYVGTILFKKHMNIIITAGFAAVAFVIIRPMALLSMVSIERYSNLIDYTNATIGVGTTIRTIPFFFLLWFYKCYRDEPVYVFTLSFTIANLFFSFLGYYVNSASRLSNMYFIFHIICFVPWLIKEEMDKNRATFFLKAFFVIYCVFTLYQLSGNFVSMGILPYR